MYYFNQPHCQDLIKEIFVQTPFSRLAGPKLNFIIAMIKQHDLTDILEIGTYAGGTAYLLAKEFPHSQITTVDLNNFEEYFQELDGAKFLRSHQTRYPQVDMQAHSMVHIQKIYKDLSPNCRWLTGDVTSIDVTNCDAVIVDGDHTITGMLSDLNHCWTNMRPGLVFVDDCVYPGIRRVCEEFCSRHGIEHTFEVHSDYQHLGSYVGMDLCVMRKS
jgi:hypothetical protein